MMCICKEFLTGSTDPLRLDPIEIASDVYDCGNILKLRLHTKLSFYTTLFVNIAANTHYVGYSDQNEQYCIYFKYDEQISGKEKQEHDHTVFEFTNGSKIYKY